MTEWQKAVIRDHDSIEKAIEILDNASLRIVFVVNADSRLIGTVTDGDIRRGILRHLSLTKSVIHVMNGNPIVLPANEKRENILRVMRDEDILQIPLTDDAGRIVEVELLQELLRKKSYSNPVVIMAGGLGSRLRPLTNDLPKPMLRIGDTPMAERIINQLVDAGFTDLFLSIGYKKEIIREYFGDGSAWGAEIKYLEETEPRGTAGALALLPESKRSRPILVMNGDILTRVDFQKLIDFHQANRTDLTLCVREFEFQVPYGVVQTRGDEFIGLKEKPSQKFFVNAGIYVVDPIVTPTEAASFYLDMPDLINQQVEQGRKISVFPIHEYWLDIGMMEQFEKAQADAKIAQR
jgi:dTDP-glucose pyrophosphorylase